MVRKGFWRLSALVAVVSLVLSGSQAAIAGSDEAAFEVVDPDSIYYGAGEHPKAPAVLSADDVWKEIPEYKKILAENLSEDDPEYHLLMLKATERFNQALKAIAKRDGYDMLGEVGSIRSRNGGSVPDVTAELVKLVTRN